MMMIPSGGNFYGGRGKEVELGFHSVLDGARGRAGGISGFLRSPDNFPPPGLRFPQPIPSPPPAPWNPCWGGGLFFQCMQQGAPPPFLKLPRHEGGNTLGYSEVWGMLHGSDSVEGRGFGRGRDWVF